MSQTLTQTEQYPSDRAKLSLVPSTFVSLVARQSRSDDGSMSVPDQIEKMRAYCETQGWGVAGVYEERDVSGRRPLSRRPGLSQAVADVESGRSEKILTCYFDRFVRSVATRAEVVQRVEARKGEVLTLDLGKTSNATAAEKLSGTILAAIAEFYADQTGEKLVTSKQRNIDRGVPPFPKITPAYRRIEEGEDKGRLEVDPVRGPLVREAIRMRLSADPASYATIARFLVENGIQITPGGVEALFASKLLVGEIHFGHFRPNLHAIDRPLIDQATYRKLNESKATRGRYSKSERLLARLGVLRCATCDSRLTVDVAMRGKGESRREYSYYRCGNRLCVAPAIVSADAAEAFVRDEAIRFGSEVEGRATADAEVEAARVAKEDAEAALDNAILSLSGLGDRPATKVVLDELQEAVDAATAKHERLLALASPETLVRTLGQWDALSFEGKRAAIRIVLDSAVVTPGRGSGRIVCEPR